jgi:hypothetical protein
MHATRPKGDPSASGGSSMRREGRDYLAGALAVYLSVLPWAMPGFSIARCHDALMNPRVGRVPGDRPPFSRLVRFPQVLPGAN